MTGENNLNIQAHSNGDSNKAISPPELLLKSALDSLPSHVAMLNQQAEIISVNASWRRFGNANGYHDYESGIGLNYLRICENATGRDAEEAGKVAQAIRDVINERSDIFQLEYPCHSPKERRWFTLQVARFEWENELRVITAHQNVTDLKMTQQAYAQSQRRLEAVINTVVDGIFTVNEQGIIETVNPAMCEIFACQPQTLIGKSIRALMPQPYNTEYVNYIRRHRQINSQRYAEIRHEIKGLRQNGQEFSMYMALSRAYLDGRWLFTGIVQDLTTRQQVEQGRIENKSLRDDLQEERDLRELKNRFMSMISHELRTPLSVIMLSSDFLRRYSDKMSEEEKLDAISTIQTQIRYLENMVDDVSALSRADRVEDSLYTETINLLDLCSDIVGNARMLSSATHQIRFNSVGDYSDMVADAKLLRQAFTNLLNNAIKYSDEGSEICFELICNETETIVRVQDQGIGIPEEDQPNLFEPFHRASNVETRQGTGLGLAVTKRAVALHGGSIFFESVLHVGTTFTIVLPPGKQVSYH